jgi:hypothetical protein
VEINDMTNTPTYHPMALIMAVKLLRYRPIKQIKRHWRKKWFAQPRLNNSINIPVKDLHFMDFDKKWARNEKNTQTVGRYSCPQSLG